jgi:predicted AlkP superfamily phosphohydrolase/phosphomutase
MKMDTPKVFLLGIDGATWKVLDQMMVGGFMPNLKSLVEQGTRGILNSTVPYLTPVAWSSLLTGVKPSKHGIFGYNVMENRKGMIVGLLANRSKIKVPTVFDIYSQLGKKVISVNMPMSYPAREEDGIIITGMMTPSKDSTFFYPQTLMQELKDQGINYRIDISVRERGVDLNERLSRYLADGGIRFFDDLHNVTTEREKCVRYLMANKEWDLFQVNFVTMDRIQHYLWNQMWNDNADPQVVGRIREHYSNLDRVIGGIHSEIQDKAILIICSDHGFGDYKGNFYPAVWLKQQGYYCERGHELTPGLIVKRILKTLGLSKAILRFLEKSETTMAKKMIYIGTSNVFWKKTKAYVYSTNGIRINVKGRDQFGIVSPGKELEDLKQEITKKLLSITDTTGQRVMKGVYPAEELYGVSNLEDAPDLFFEFEDENFYTTYYSVTESSVYLDKGYFWRQGDHRRDGVVLLAGKGVAAGKTVSADIEDVLPTILFMQNLPLSGNFDGKVIGDAFTDDFLAGRKTPDKRSFVRGEVEGSETDKGDEVIDRLKGLGYI